MADSDSGTSTGGMLSEDEHTGDDAPPARRTRSQARHAGAAHAATLNVPDPASPHWMLVCASLSPVARGTQTVYGVQTLEEILMTYVGVAEAGPERKQPQRRLKFSSLRRLAKRGDLPHRFFHTVLPFMAYTALQLHALFREPVPLLGHGKTGVVSLSRQQAACLLANMFLCTLPQPAMSRRIPKYPENNFLPLLCASQPQEIAKVQCYLHYFARISGAVPPPALPHRSGAKAATGDAAVAGVDGAGGVPLPLRGAEPPAAAGGAIVAGVTIEDDGHPAYRPGTPMTAVANTASMRSPASTPPVSSPRPSAAHAGSPKVSPARHDPPALTLGAQSDDDVDMAAELQGSMPSGVATSPPASPLAGAPPLVSTPPIHVMAAGGAGAGAGANAAVGRGTGTGAGATAGTGAVPASSQSATSPHRAALDRLRGLVHIRRVSLAAKPGSFWRECRAPLEPVEMGPHDAGIEDAAGCLQVSVQCTGCR